MGDYTLPCGGFWVTSERTRWLEGQVSGFSQSGCYSLRRRFGTEWQSEKNQWLQHKMLLRLKVARGSCCCRDKWESKRGVLGSGRRWVWGEEWIGRSWRRLPFCEQWTLPLYLSLWLFSVTEALGFWVCVVEVLFCFVLHDWWEMRVKNLNRAIILLMLIFKTDFPPPVSSSLYFTNFRVIYKNITYF